MTSTNGTGMSFKKIRTSRKYLDVSESIQALQKKVFGLPKIVWIVFLKIILGRPIFSKVLILLERQDVFVDVRIFFLDNFRKSRYFLNVRIFFWRPDRFYRDHFGKSGYFLNVRIFFLTPGSFLSRPFWEVRILFERPDLFVGLPDRFLGHKFRLTNTKIRK